MLTFNVRIVQNIMFLKFVDVFSFKLQGIPLNVTAYTGSYAVYAGKGRGKNFGNKSTINII